MFPAPAAPTSIRDFCPSGGLGIGLCGPGLPASTRVPGLSGGLGIGLCGAGRPASTRHFCPSGEQKTMSLAPAAPPSTQDSGHYGEHKIMLLAPAAPPSIQVSGTSGELDRAAGRPTSNRVIGLCGGFDPRPAGRAAHQTSTVNVKTVYIETGCKILPIFWSISV